MMHIQLLSLHTLVASDVTYESDGLCGAPIKAILNLERSDGVLYQSQFFQAEINIVDTSSIEYQIIPLEEHLQNWEDWHPIHWVELFQIARALEDFSEKTGSLENAHCIKGFQLNGNQYIDETTNTQKINFTFLPCYSSDFSIETEDRMFNQRRVTSPIERSIPEHDRERLNSHLIRSIKNQFDKISRAKLNFLKTAELLPTPSFCCDCRYATEQKTSSIQSAKPFWVHTQRESSKGGMYHDISHAQHICLIHDCADVMTLELTQALSSLMVRTTEESPENFDIHICSYNKTTNKHLTCRIIPKTLTSFTSRKESTDTESSEESALIQTLPVENNKKVKPLVRQRRLKEIKVQTAVAEREFLTNETREATPPPPSTRQSLRKRFSDARYVAQKNTWIDNPA